MIAIVNVSAAGTPDDQMSVYEVRINRKVMARFHHVRTDPLEVCLHKAANAVAKSQATGTETRAPSAS